MQRSSRLLGWQQRELAYDIGVGQGDISLFEAGSGRLDKKVGEPDTISSVGQSAQYALSPPAANNIGTATPLERSPVAQGAYHCAAREILFAMRFGLRPKAGRACASPWRS
jgi:hypothetical protein